MNAPCLRASGSSRAGAGGAGGNSASPDHDRFTHGLRRDSAQRVFAPIFENQGDGLRQTRAALFDRPALSVGPGDFGAVADEPVFVALDDGREFVVHIWSCLTAECL